MPQWISHHATAKLQSQHSEAPITAWLVYTNAAATRRPEPLHLWFTTQRSHPRIRKTRSIEHGHREFDYGLNTVTHPVSLTRPPSPLPHPNSSPPLPLSSWHSSLNTTSTHVSLDAFMHAELSIVVIQSKYLQLGLTSVFIYVQKLLWCFGIKSFFFTSLMHASGCNASTLISTGSGHCMICNFASTVCGCRGFNASLEHGKPCLSASDGRTGVRSRFSQYLEHSHVRRGIDEWKRRRRNRQMSGECLCTMHAYITAFPSKFRNIWENFKN